jgi:hypothetical protein
MLGDKILEVDTVRNFLVVVPKKYNQIACAIKTLDDIDTLSVEDLIGRLKAVEEPYELEQLEDTIDAGNKLYLTPRKVYGADEDP